MVDRIDVALFLRESAKRLRIMAITEPRISPELTQMADELDQQADELEAALRKSENSA